MVSIAVFFVIITDWSFMKLKFQDEHIQLTGFFGFRKFSLQMTPFRVMKCTNKLMI